MEIRNNFFNYYEFDQRIYLNCFPGDFLIFYFIGSFSQYVFFVLSVERYSFSMLQAKFLFCQNSGMSMAKNVLTPLVFNAFIIIMKAL